MWGEKKGGRAGGWEGWGCLCSCLLRAAGEAWRRGEGTTRQGPRWHSDGNTLQLPSGSFVCFIKQLQTLRCFTAVYAALPGGTFTTVLYGQIICNIEALMTTRNYPRFNYGTLRRWQGQETALHGCRPVRVCLGGRRRVTFGTRRLFFLFFSLERRRHITHLRWNAAVKQWEAKERTPEHARIDV